MNPLTAMDYAALEKSYLTREIIDAAQIRRVETIEGGAIVGRPATATKDYAGLIFPYLWPGDTRPREYRLRRDSPDLERKPDGSIKERNKYLSPPGRGNLLYIPPDTPAEWLTDASIPATFTEGEKKALALSRFYRERGEKRLVIGLSGVWNWRGAVGKVTNSNGKRQNVSGVISDFDRIEWKGRAVLIVFDVNALTDETVAAARRELAREFQRRGAAPSWVNLPTGIQGVNGVDDLLARCGPDFVAGLFVNAVNSVADAWEPPTPFGEYDLPPFPLDALPDWLRSFVQGLAVETQTPADLAATLTLANCSATLAGRVVVRVREGWTEPVNSYWLNVLGVGNCKTAVHDAAKAPLEEVEQRLCREMEPEVNRARIERDMLAARLEHLKKAAAKENKPEKRQALIDEAKDAAAELAESRAPASPKLIVSGDITPEALASMLAEQGGRLFLSSDEGELFEMAAGRYGNGANIETLLKAHTGGKVRINRRGRAEIIESATLTIGMTVQPDVLRGIAEKPTFRGRGLCGRFLYTIPKSLVGGRNSKPAPLSDEAQNEYTRRLKTLAAFEKVTNADGEPAPRVVKLSRDALDYLTAFMDELEPQMAEGGALYSVADWATKLAGAVARIAAIIHFAANAYAPGSITEIPAGSVQRAIKIGRYLIPHALAAYAEMGADPQIENAKYLLRWIQKEALAQFTKREAHRENRGRFKEVTEIEPALELLEAHGYIRALVRAADLGRPGRKASQLFEVNPAAFIEKSNFLPLDTMDTMDKTFSEMADSVHSVHSVHKVESLNFSDGAMPAGRQPSATREVFNI